MRAGKNLVHLRVNFEPELCLKRVFQDAVLTAMDKGGIKARLKIIKGKVGFVVGDWVFRED